MPKRKLRYPETPWQPDPKKWAKLLEKQLSGKPEQLAVPNEPVKGWELWRWDTLEDVKQ